MEPPLFSFFFQLELSRGMWYLESKVLTIPAQAAQLYVTLNLSINLRKDFDDFFVEMFLKIYH